MTYLTDERYNQILQSTFNHLGFITGEYVLLKKCTIKELEKRIRDAFTRVEYSVDKYAIMVTVVNHELWSTYNATTNDEIPEHLRKRYNSVAHLYDRMWRIHHNKATSLFKGEDYRRYWELTD